MIYPATYYEGKCDACGKQWSDEHTALKDPDDLEYSMLESAWILYGGKHYCPDCWEIGDNDEVVIKPRKMQEKINENGPQKENH